MWVDVTPSKSLESWYHFVIRARLNGAVSVSSRGTGLLHNLLLGPQWVEPATLAKASLVKVVLLRLSLHWAVTVYYLDFKAPTRKFYLWVTAKLLSPSGYKKRGTTLPFLLMSLCIV